MTGAVVIDANLLLLLVVGSASREYIARHKRLNQIYTTDDFELLGLIIANFSEIVLLPHILTEVSNFVGHIDNPAKSRVRSAMRTLILTGTEIPAPSAAGVQRNEFNALGLTDAVILHLCSMTINGVSPTLVTVDTALADNAHSLGYSVIDYKANYLMR